MAKQNKFFGATLSYANTISYYYRQDDFSRFIIQAMIENGAKADDDYTVVLWAIDDKGNSMNGDSPIKVPLTNISIPANKKVHFANVPLYRKQLDEIYTPGTFDIELRPVKYSENQDYIAFEVYKADEMALIALTTLNPSPPARSL